MELRENIFTKTNGPEIVRPSVVMLRVALVASLLMAACGRDGLERESDDIAEMQYAWLKAQIQHDNCVDSEGDFYFRCKEFPGTYELAIEECDRIYDEGMLDCAEDDVYQSNRVPERVCGANVIQVKYFDNTATWTRDMTDTDDDGVANYDELVSGTDPCVQYTFDTLHDGFDHDFDGDGLPNAVDPTPLCDDVYADWDFNPHCAAYFEGP